MEPSGFISKDEIEEIYHAASALRLPSLGLRRGLGHFLITVGEGLAAQQIAGETPQIATEPC